MPRVSAGLALTPATPKPGTENRTTPPRGPLEETTADPAAALPNPSVLIVVDIIGAIENATSVARGPLASPGSIPTSNGSPFGSKKLTVPVTLDPVVERLSSTIEEVRPPPLPNWG